MRQPTRRNLRALYITAASLFFALAAARVSAQSSDVGFPSPVFSSDVSGRIAPRDVGDSRRTRHFYTFRGDEGDLVVNLEASNLTGDVDVFMATTLRPLLKFTLFGDTVRLSKSFYLRKEETLILRVEARAVGDAEGAYSIRFGGSFLPAPANLAGAQEPSAPTLSASESRGKNTRRVTATGARIEEPAPVAPPKEEAKERESQPAPTPAVEKSSEPRSTASSRRSRGSRPAPSRSRAGTTRPGAAKTESPEAKTETTETKTAENSSAAPGSTSETPAANTPAPTTAPRRRGARSPRRSAPRESAETRGAEPKSAEKTAQPNADGQPAPAVAQPAAAAPAQRLIIVTKDGETLERDMSLVRRVTIENNQVVIVTRDGKVIRRPLASVLKMSIEP
ncbi:MAG: hypothetical protein QOC99_3052 [Acidobacteriota bacterium]|nr:hypothetical protein [Acidobacteriota bacterium]